MHFLFNYLKSGFAKERKITSEFKDKLLPRFKNEFEENMPAKQFRPMSRYFYKFMATLMLGIIPLYGDLSVSGLMGAILTFFVILLFFFALNLYRTKDIIKWDESECVENSDNLIGRYAVQNSITITYIDDELAVYYLKL